MSIMAFELPIMEMAFALSEFEFKVFTLAIDFQFRIVTFGNRFLNLSSHFKWPLSATVFKGSIRAIVTGLRVEHTMLEFRGC